MNALIAVVLLTLSRPLVTLITATLIPLITGYLTSIRLAGWVKGVITLLLNAVVAVITTNLDPSGAAIISSQTFMNAIIGFIISLGAYHGILKGAKLTSSRTDGKLSPESGLDSPKAT